MPDFMFTITVQNITAAQAQNIQQRLIQRLGTDQVTVQGSSITPLTQTYRVIGVDTATRQRFDVTVDAATQDDAEAKVVTDVSTRVVAMSRTVP